MVAPIIWALPVLIGTGAGLWQGIKKTFPEGGQLTTGISEGLTNLSLISLKIA